MLNNKSGLFLIRFIRRNLANGSKKISIKRAIKIIINLPSLIIGVAIAKLPFFNRYKLHLLSTFGNVDKRSKVDEYLYTGFFYVWERYEYLKVNNTEKREELKSLAMDNAYLKYAIRNQKPFDLNAKTGNMTVKEVKKIFGEIITILSNAKSNYVVIQIGCHSGKEVAFLAKKFPDHQFVGTDLFEEGVQLLRQYHNYPNLTFFVSPAKYIGNLFKELKIESTDIQVIVYTSGTAIYIHPEDLTVFFDYLSKYSNVHVLLNEAVWEPKAKVDKLTGSVRGGNFSYSHNYKWY
jgi:hypothetical protein